MKLLISSISLLLLLFPASSLTAAVNAREPKVFSLLSLSNPNEYLVFFSTMEDFQRRGATLIMYFLAIAGEDIKATFKPSDAECIANGSYCFVRGRLPELQPHWCVIDVTLRIVRIKGDQCLPNECPNIFSPEECGLRVQQGTKECLNMVRPKKPCRYPSSISSYLPSNATEPAKLASVSNCEQPPITVSVLIACLVVAVIVVVISLVLLQSVRQQIRSRLVVLVKLGEADDSDDIFLYLLKPPIKLDLQQIKQMPEHSFIQAAVPLKRPVL